MGSSSNSTTVLVVENERTLADLYADWLRDSYTVETAYSGEEALSELDEDVDVVLLDRAMPNLTGDEVLECIREQGLEVRVAIVSGLEPDFDVIGMGFDEYLQKPVDAEELHDVVDRLVERTWYNDAREKLERLTAAKAALEESKSESELQQSREYQELKTEIESAKEQASEHLEEFNDEDFSVAFRDLGETEQSGIDGDDR